MEEENLATIMEISGLIKLNCPEDKAFKGENGATLTTMPAPGQRRRAAQVGLSDSGGVHPAFHDNDDVNGGAMWKTCFYELRRRAIARQLRKTGTFSNSSIHPFTQGAEMFIVRLTLEAWPSG